MKYVIYTRASKIKRVRNDNDELVEVENSITHSMQLDECLKLIEDENYQVFAESNVSGDDPLSKRPVLADAMNALKKGDVFMIWASDRLFRKTDYLIPLLADLERRGIKIQSATEKDLFESGEEAKLKRMMISAFSEYELAKIRRRVKTSLKNKIEKGECLGHIPFGYRKEGKYLVVEPSEQKILDEMEAMRAQGVTYRNIAEALNRKGYRNRAGGGPRRQGGNWTYRSVHRLLSKRSTHQERMEALVKQ